MKIKNKKTRDLAQKLVKKDLLPRNRSAPDLAQKLVKKGLLPRNRSGAMEMSVGTIVTIVLLMSVLVLGIFLVQKIFKTGTSAIDSVDSQLTSEINKLFASEGKNFGIYPSSQQITLKKGDDPRGFAFSIKNPFTETRKFNYLVEATDVTGSGSLTIAQANSWLRYDKGPATIGAGSSPTLAEKVLFVIPSTAPPCTITYRVTVEDDKKEFAEGGSVFVTIK